MSSRRPAAQRAAELRFCGVRLVLGAPARAAAGPLVAVKDADIVSARSSHADILSAEQRATDVRRMLCGLQSFAQLSVAARSDLEVVLAAVSQRNEAIYAVERGLLFHPAVMLTVVNRNGVLLHDLKMKHHDPGWLPERALLLAALAQNGLALKWARLWDARLCDDGEVVLAAVAQNGLALRYASDALQEDRELVWAAVSSNGLALQYASDTLRGDGEVVLTAVAQKGLALQYASDTLRADGEVVLTAVLAHASDPDGKHFVSPLQHASDLLRADRAVVLAAVRQQGSALEYASDTLRGDREVVLAAVRRNKRALQYASESLRADHEVVLNSMGPYGFPQYASPALLRDKPFMLDAVAKVPRLVLQDASAALKEDPEVVLAAVLAWGGALEHASVDLQSDKQLVLAAVRQDGAALAWASEPLRGDREVVLAAVAMDGFALREAAVALQSDRDVVLAAVRQAGEALQFASELLRSDREVVLAAVTQDGWAMHMAAEALHSDREVALAAAATVGMEAVNLALEAGLDLRADREVMLAAAGSAYQSSVLDSGAGNLTGALPAYSDEAAFEAARALDMELTLVVVAERGRLLQHASLEMQAEREVVLTAVREDSFALSYASPALKGDRDVVLAAITSGKPLIATDPGSLDALAAAGSPAIADPTVALTAVEIDADAMKYFESAVWRDRAVVLEAVLQQEILKGRSTGSWSAQGGGGRASRPRRALDTYPLRSCGWEADPFLQEITAYPERSLAAFDGLAGAHRRLAFASLALQVHPAEPELALAEPEPELALAEPEPELALAEPEPEPVPVPVPVPVPAPALSYDLFKLMSYDLMDLIVAYTSRAGVVQWFRGRAAAAGGFLSQEEWTGGRQEYDYEVPSVS